MFTLLLRIAFDAILAASAVGIYLFCISPQLLARRARWPAFVVAGTLAAAVPPTLFLSARLPIPTYLVPVQIVVLLGIWSWPDALLRITGGPRPLPEDVQAVFSAVTRAWERFEVGDVDGAQDEVAGLDRLRTPATTGYVDLWRRWIDEEMARRSGRRASSRETMQAIRAEAAALSSSGRPAALVRTSLLLALAAILGGAPALANARACIGVEILLPRHGDSGLAQPAPLSGALLTDPEPGSVLLFDEAMDLETAAESRHDPDTRAQLIEAGFIAAHSRGWQAADRRRIHADVFEFRDAAGALTFQRSVNRYACRFSNETFEAPAGGLGLQVRWSRADPIEEQISWVAGSRRYRVAVRALAPPQNHERVLRLAERQADHAVH